MIIDSHAHLDDAKFDSDKDKVIQRAVLNDVKYIINVATSVDASRISIKLADEYQCIYAAIGIHPHCAGDFRENDLSVLEELAGHKKVAAVGEIGLDYYRDLSPREKQIEVFKKFLKFANKLNLPVIIHERNAAKDLISILNEEPVNKKGVFHCFSGDELILNEGLKSGFYFAVGGVITFPNAVKLREAVSNIPLDKLIVETDCPYLSPQLYRGQRNEPSFIIEVLKKISEIKKIDYKLLEEKIFNNTLQLFNLKS